MPLHIIDTAGLRDSPDEVERIGIQRAWQEIQQADRVLLLVDSGSTTEFEAHKIWPEFVDKLEDASKLTLVRNKIDLSGEAAGLAKLENGASYIGISAATGAGMEDLKQHLKDIMGFSNSGEGGFTARRRHLDALERAQSFLALGKTQLHGYAAGELLAEDLRQAQNALSEITGEFTPDDLLGRIFSSFCIGK